MPLHGKLNVCVCALWFICSRAVGYRFGPHLSEVVPLLISYCESASENDDELRENSLQVPLYELFPPLTGVYQVIPVTGK